MSNLKIYTWLYKDKLFLKNIMYCVYIYLLFIPIYNYKLIIYNSMTEQKQSACDCLMNSDFQVYGSIMC